MKTTKKKEITKLLENQIHNMRKKHVYITIFIFEECKIMNI